MDHFAYQPFRLWATGDQIEAHAGILAYDKTAPSTVEIVFPHHDNIYLLGSLGTVTSYNVPRELLSAGLQHCATWGEISIRPHRMDGWLVVTLPIDGQVRDFYADAFLVRAFLNATAELAPLEVSA